ncbi:MAG: lasso peptide isopeptide bond-forming cyclase [Leptolyngbya sp. SIO1E4]|nr:lasso peptide isopeptide bond-forming cyclase [Leptolyngbya sp. SIO1E4]
MSGLVGIVSLNHHAARSTDVATMLDTLAHRGPNGVNSWVQGRAGLGHRMLWTTPESLLEVLPLVDHAGELVLTADARIDNREALFEELEFGDRPLEKIPDSDFILAAYQKWGTACPEHLLGAFAFAIWDASKHSLFCARDHLGVKPFYYYHQPDQAFVFASEIKAILALPQVPRHLNEGKLGEYLALMMHDRTLTSYCDVLRLPPAHSLLVVPSGLKLWSYWSLDPDYELKLDSDEAYAEAFRELFTEAVRCRLRSAFPLGSHLSGGLDSSSVTCVARQLMANIPDTYLHTFSNIFDEVAECDERPYINTVLDQGGLIPHYVHADQFGPLSDTAEIWQYEDEGLLGPSHSYPWHLNRATQQAGVRIVLDGLDGDTTVSHGFFRLTELARQRDWLTFCREADRLAKNFNCPPQLVLRRYGYPILREWGRTLKWASLAQAIRVIYQQFGISRKRMVIEFGLKPLISPLTRLFRPNTAQATLGKVAYPSLVKQSFAKRINLDCRVQTGNQIASASSTVREDHWQSLTHGILPFVLEQLDRCAAAFSLEMRHPFMDKRLIEFCLALPAEQKLNQGWSRMILRRGLAGILPEAVQWRGGKADMTTNFLHGLLVRDRQKLDDVMLHHLELLEPYVNLDILKAAYRRLTSGRKASKDDKLVVWRAVILALWLQRHSTN